MLISVEHEMPVVSSKGRSGIVPEVFTNLWDELSTQGWERENDFTVCREVATASLHAEKPKQTITTDTGPTIEMSPTPCERIQDIDEQLRDMRTAIAPNLESHGLRLLGSGVHPYVDTSAEDYYRFRTQRTAYDYAILKRGWEHRTILNIAAMQEVIDIPVALAPRIVSVMHRLAGIMTFLFRNDPEIQGNHESIYSIRPRAWRHQIPLTARFPSDARKVFVPTSETDTWDRYLSLLWKENPMFLIGTKDSGLVYLPEHPTFADFLQRNHAWSARQLEGGTTVSVVPDMSHVAQTDWTYMGFARLRLFWHDGVSIQELQSALNAGGATLDAFLAKALRKVLLENRSTATPLPGREVSSLAFITGLLENFEETERFVRGRGYNYWLMLGNLAETTPLASNHPAGAVFMGLDRLLGLSITGLKRRAFNEEVYLEPLLRAVKDQTSQSEQLLERYRSSGIGGVIQMTRY